ncbi:hypothetical protein N0V83_001644 [Neocucurbitaria cava]|uniref:Uncharacterized protein n=1 Tax=Neocucurbitaria cava TaxID=798079 RepID=A0A9W8YFA0_9PLEO|nr:hypothetical protein N0V83_001644 [Neocucurbitaria cava]
MHVLLRRPNSNTMSRKENVNFSKGYGFSLPDSNPPSPDSPLLHQYYRDWQLDRRRKRRRAEEDAEYMESSAHTEEQEPARKTRVTETMRVQENARYGLIPATGRRAIRWTEEFLRTLAIATLEELAAIYHATLRGVAEKEAEYQSLDEEDEQEPAHEQTHETTSRERGNYQPYVEEVDDEGDVDMSGDQYHWIPSENIDSRDTNSFTPPLSGIVPSNSNNSTSRPDTTILPSYLIPARVPSLMANRRKTNALSNGRAKGALAHASVPLRSSNAKTQAQPATSSLRNVQMPMKPVLYQPSNPTRKSPSEHVIEKLFGRPASRKFSPLFAPATVPPQYYTSSRPVTPTARPNLPPTSLPSTSSPSPSPPTVPTQSQPLHPMPIPSIRVQRPENSNVFGKTTQRGITIQHETNSEEDYDDYEDELDESAHQAPWSQQDAAMQRQIQFDDSDSNDDESLHRAGQALSSHHPHHHLTHHATSPNTNTHNPVLPTRSNRLPPFQQKTETAKQHEYFYDDDNEDVMFGMTLVSYQYQNTYNRPDLWTSEDEEYLCSGGAGPPESCIE